MRVFGTYCVYMTITLLSSNAYASDQPLFSVDIDRINQLAKIRVVEKYPSLAGQKLPTNSTIVVCNESGQSGCTAITNVEIASKSSLERNGEICTTLVEYKSLQVHIKAAGESIIGGDLASPNYGTRSVHSECPMDY